MIQEFKAGPRTLGMVEGPAGFIITSADLCHSVYSLNEPASLNVAPIFNVEYQDFTLTQIRAIANPVSIADFCEYWGIKQRVAGNYQELLKSMREIGINTKAMPRWGERSS